jgi:3-hydroxyisobutyrate dehydrogenase
VLVDCSTLTVEWVRELAKAAEAHGCAFVDAPVTGSKAAAANGELNFLVGGGDAALEKIRPALAAMSRSIVHLGPTGSGALVKLINNFVCGVQVAAIAEAFAWVERSGLDRAKAMSILIDGAPGSPLVKTIAARMTADDYTPNFLLRLMAKDLGYAIKEGAAAGTPLATPVKALEVFQRAIAAGLGEKDMAAVVEPLRERKR